MQSFNIDQSTSESPEISRFSDWDSPRRNETEDQYAAPCGLELLTLIPHGGYDRAIATGVSRLTALVPKLARDERPVGLW